MNTRIGWLLAAGLLLAGCNSYVQLPTPTPGAAPLASQAAWGLNRAADPQPALVSATVAPAPVCEVAASCAALNAEQIPLDCVKKVPYTNVLVPRGTQFEVLDKTGEFACLDSGVVVGGSQVITCHGRQLYAFQLRLTNPACAGAALPSGNGACQTGFGYDASKQCCAPLSDASQGATTVTVNLGACPVPGP